MRCEANPERFCEACSDDQIIGMAERHLARFNRYWGICMRSHYSTGVYIDAQQRMNSELEILARLRSYVYSNRPAPVSARLEAVIGA